MTKTKRDPHLWAGMGSASQHLHRTCPGSHVTVLSERRAKSAEENVPLLREAIDMAKRAPKDQAVTVELDDGFVVVRVLVATVDSLTIVDEIMEWPAGTMRDLVGKDPPKAKGKRRAST